MRQATHTRVVSLPECVLFSGSLESLPCVTPALTTHEPRTLLVHAPANSASTGYDDASHQGMRSFLLAAGDTQTDMPAGMPVLALAVPRARVTTTLLAEVAELDQTPLVRASRPLIVSLLASRLAESSAESARAVDDVLLAVVRGILQENPQTAAPDSREATLAVRLSALIEARHSDPRLDVAQIARELHTSRRQLYRHVDGAGVAALLTERRIETARDLLVSHPDLTVAEIAERSGFASASRLRARFAERLGVTPTAYRRGHIQPEVAPPT